MQGDDEYLSTILFLIHPCTKTFFPLVLLSCSNIYYINDNLDKRTWTYIFGACCATTVFIPSFHNYRIWSFLGLLMTTYTAWYLTAAALLHGQVMIRSPTNMLLRPFVSHVLDETCNLFQGGRCHPFRPIQVGTVLHRRYQHPLHFWRPCCHSVRQPPNDLYGSMDSICLASSDKRTCVAERSCTPCGSRRSSSSCTCLPRSMC